MASPPPCPAPATASARASVARPAPGRSAPSAGHVAVCGSASVQAAAPHPPPPLRYGDKRPYDATVALPHLDRAVPRACAHVGPSAASGQGDGVHLTSAEYAEAYECFRDAFQRIQPGLWLQPGDHACQSDCPLLNHRELYICCWSGNSHSCTEMSCELAVVHDDAKVCPITAKQYPLEFQTTYEQGNISNERRMMTRVAVSTKRKRARGSDGLSISAASARASALALGSGESGSGGGGTVLCSPSPSPASSISPASVAASSPSPSSSSSHSTFFPPPSHPHRHRAVSASAAAASPSSCLSLSTAATPHFGYHNEADALHAICPFIARCLPLKPDVEPLSRARTMELAREILATFRIVHRVAGDRAPREYTLFVHTFVSLHIMAKGGEDIGGVYLVRGHPDVAARIPEDPAISFAILRRQHSFHTRMVRFFNSIVSQYCLAELKTQPVIKD